MMLLSISRKSASIRSFSSGAKICTKLTVPSFLPMRNILPVLNSKELGAIKSLVDSPEGASQSHEKRNGSCSSMRRMSCMTRRRSYPFSGAATTPSRLKLLRRSVSMRSKRGFAVRRLSASMPKVRYLVLIRPLLPRASWFCSISAYSARIASNSSPQGGMVMLRAKVSCDADRLTKESWNCTELSK